MKECFFCLEQMLEQEYVCKHCKNWQPAKSEIEKNRGRVIGDLVSSHMGIGGFYKAVFRGTLGVALLIALWLVFEVGFNSSLMIERLIEWRSQTLITGAIVFVLVSVIVFSVNWELMRAKIKVAENKYLIERTLRYQLRGVSRSAFDLYKLDVHAAIVGLVILAAIILSR